MRLIGLDPGLRHTGWGVIDAAGNRLSHVADGVVHSRSESSLAERLSELYRQLNAVLDEFAPDAAAVEETFVNKNPSSTLRLGMARGVALLVPAERGLPVFEYATNLVKKSIVGVGHADKAQVQMMVRRLLPGARGDHDASDALAVAICHAHHAATAQAISPARLSSSSHFSTPSPTTRPIAKAIGPVGFDRFAIERVVPSPRGGEGGAAGMSRETLSPAGRGQGEGAEDPKRKPTDAETSRARRLRRDATDAEALLWRKLRNRQIENAKFRRQEPILGFTADFVCHEARLVIEIDGGQHALRVAHDDRRSGMLAQAGFRVVRFWNSDVFDNLDGVLERIRESLMIAGAAR